MLRDCGAGGARLPLAVISQNTQRVMKGEDSQ
jgi:hypothetical protein